MFNSNRYRADGSMTTHRQTATGFNKQNANIIFRIGGRIQNAAAHHVVTAWLKHQPLSYPIKLPQKVLTLFTHVFTIQNWPSACNHSYRVSTSMRIDTEKGVHVFEC